MQQFILPVLGGTAGALLTFLLHKHGLSVVVASCLVGLLGAGLGYLTQSSHLPLVVFAGSFVGMTSATLGTIPLMLLGGAVCGIIYQLSLTVFVGFGGRLGTIAFISTVLSYYALVLLKKWFLSNK